MPPIEDLPLVLVVDDDDVFRSRLCRAFSERNWAADAVSNGNAALIFAKDRSPDLVLVDLRMPGMGGLDLVQELRAVDSSMKIVMLTGYGSIPTAISAVKRGADYYLSKPIDVDQILAAYENLRSVVVGDSEGPESVPTLARVE
jgi:two-component system response regulator RegA